ncbi:MAG: phosphoribosylglycinamide formyltransferase [Rickettsiales bacterium]|jgi:phosphoribosylglycinamide formyltransferase-1|nr:phosphoribosylglycinamide formyltransferase [Rickettsiales bacterium]
MSKTLLAVLISGNGSNLQALIDACRVPDFPAEIALVISNKADGYGLTRAKQAGIPALVIDHKAYASREDFDRAMHEELTRHQVQMVCLAGFMRLLSSEFVEKWQRRMINIHPSLLPKFKGAHAIRDALAAGEKVTGCSVHYVVAEMDAGEIILQEEVEIRPGDTHDTLAARIHAAEHRIYVEAVRRLASLPVQYR